MEKVVRTACRAILLTPENEILLIQLSNPSSDWKGWILPGGGVDPSESHEQSLRREMREELGLKRFMFEGPVWTRFHAFPWGGKFYEQSELFFLVLIKKFEPRPEIDPRSSEMMDFQEFRWWKIDEIERSKEDFAPRELARHLKKMVRDGIPDEPIDVSDR